METVVCVIDASGVRSGRVEPNKEMLTEQGCLILNESLIQLSPDQAAQIKNARGAEYDFTSGPVMALHVKKEGGYNHFAAHRSMFDDMYTSADAWTTLRDQRIFFPEAARLERTLVLVKPNYSQEDYTKILNTIDQNNFVLVGKLARIVTKEASAAMFNDSEDDVKHVTSDVSVALVIEKVGAVEEWQLLMGPEDPAIACVVAPNSLRGSLNCTSTTDNVIYGSESVEKAKRDIALLFPAPFAMERTLAIVKPDVVRNGHLDAVMEVIKENGFTVLASQQVDLSQQRAAQFYGAVPAVVARYLASGPSQVMVLGKPGALVAWQKLVGSSDPAEADASSLAGRFGADALRNGFHYSPSATKAKSEINFFFPQLRVETLPSLSEVNDALNMKPAPRPHVEAQKSLNDVLIEGLTQLCHVKPIGNDAITWLGQWLLRNNPNKPFVGEPVVEVPEQGVYDQLAEASGEAVDVVWALGGPHSGRDAQVSFISKSFGHEVIDVVEILQASETSGSEYGELLKDCREKGKAVPTHVPVNLVKDAMLGAKGKSKFVITGFPATMDQALHFEKVIGEASKIVFFDCTDSTKEARLRGSEDPAGDEAATKAFKQGVYPIVEQYQQYNKVKKIPTDGAASVTQSRIKKYFS